MRINFVFAVIASALFLPSLSSAEFGEATLVEHPGFFHKQGPNDAKGVIVWSPGYSGNPNRPHPRVNSGGMPHVLDWLYGHGWDVYYVERTGSNRFSDRERHANSLRRAVSGLKDAGYEKIVLAGQSSGGTYSMMAASEDLGLHAIVLAGSGPSDEGKGQTPLYLDFYDALRDAQADRFLVLHFLDDDVIGQRSKTELERVLQGSGSPYINIHEPSGIEGHSGAFLSTFSKRFGGCILRFLEPARRPTGSECNGR